MQIENAITIEVSRDELRSIIADEVRELTGNIRAISADAAHDALIMSGLVSDMITKREAYRLFGRKTVDRWLREGHILAYSDCKRGRTRISRSELHKCAKQFNVAMLPDDGQYSENIAF